MIFKVLNLPNANVNSVLYWLKRCGFHGEILDLDASEIPIESFLIIPGVGSFDFVMENLIINEMDKKIKDHLINSGRVLSICLGMQILFESSAEGRLEGLKIFKGKIKKLSSGDMNIPNIGWRNLKHFRGKSIPKEDKFYFMHSYCLSTKNLDDSFQDISISCSNEQFVAYFRYKNIYCVQFHPEKSGLSGINFFKKIVRENESSC